MIEGVDDVADVHRTDTNRVQDQPDSNSKDGERKSDPLLQKGGRKFRAIMRRIESHHLCNLLKTMEITNKIA